ncbi:Ribosome-inactivating protein [Penicillium longicatenatum]|uniref:Ribosome-inactivating protein n=1 Tax=Penicillium longicatenatum TaxID=1561947 RepID=UPI0025487475|nr:Ribosome-inactivating protein [Penicillium longicatenatum]KAJ5658189.1 Ribosome-inactivating protein [Penicillium longicatenatum]
MSNASEALVDIFLADMDGEDPTNIYDKKIQLFRRESNDHVGVNLHSCIPLLRLVLSAFYGALGQRTTALVAGSVSQWAKAARKAVASGNGETRFEEADQQLEDAQRQYRGKEMPFTKRKSCFLGI